MAKTVPAVETGLANAFGAGVAISDEDTPEIRLVWNAGHIEVVLAERVAERRLRALWRKWQQNRAKPLLLVSETADSHLQVLGPQRADDPIRGVALPSLISTLVDLQGKSRRDAVAALQSALERIDTEGVPGIVIRGLLTRHVLTRRLKRNHPKEWKALEEAAKKVKPSAPWRENLAALGYEITPRQDRGHVLRHEGRPLVVLHPFADATAFSRMTEEGSTPEGLLVADCRAENVAWGLLATDSRFRLFPAETAVGAATARYLEMDITTTQPEDWTFLGLLAPDSLAPGGLLERLVQEAEQLGNELRDDVERRIREDVLPSIARGLGDHQRSGGHDLASPESRQLNEDATLLVVFRLIFLLWLEGRDFLPVASTAYGPHSATQLLRDARAQDPTFDERATTLWDRFTTLVNAVRSGNSAWGLPPYNGDLFAGDVLPGAELLEEATLTDSRFGPAIASLAQDPEGEDIEAGVDFGDLEIAHLGRIYEGLLSLRLSLATEPMAYDTKADRWMPAKKEDADIEEGELFFQSTTGGRKAAGVYYTPQVLVRHLVDHAVLPALESHLDRVAAESNANQAAAMLFDFKVLDPAMGSAHFLADALDRIAERIGTFLAEHPLKPVVSLLDELRAEATWEGRIDDGDLLRRLVLKRCIYGVDLSRMAVEVGKVSLWLASFVPGLSLAYLGHNLQQGDSLVGVADPEVLADLGPFFAENPDAPIPRALQAAREVAGRISETPDRSPEEVEASRNAQAELDELTRGLDHVFTIWSAEPFRLSGARDWLAGACDKVLNTETAKGDDRFLHPALDIAEERDFFHWPVAFPEVFARDDPGFDAVIGNPPWDEVNVEELGFYALHDPGIRGLTSRAAREERIKALVKRFPELEQDLEARRKHLHEARPFYGPAGGYTKQGAGNLDLYELFTERYSALTRERGWLGVVLPRTAFLGVGSQGFREWVFNKTEVRRLDFILNNRSWAFPIHPQYTIALVAARRTKPSEESDVRLSGPSSSQEIFERASSGEGAPIHLSDLQAWTRTDGQSSYEVPLLGTATTAEVFGRLRLGQRFDRGYEGRWSAFAVQGDFNETSHKKFFQHEEGVPVWKGRSFDQFDPHGADPAGFADEGEAIERLQSKRMRSKVFKDRFSLEVLEDPKTHPYYAARIAFRDVTNRTNSRTVLACLVPPNTFLTNSAPYLVFPEGSELILAFVLGVLNSLPFDWQARRFVETHVNFYILDMLCFPPADQTDIDGIAERSARLSCIDDRFVDFANAAGLKEIGQLDPEERDHLRAEIDALVAKAYGLTENDLEVMFSDFTENAVPEPYRTLVRSAFS